MYGLTSNEHKIANKVNILTNTKHIHCNSSSWFDNGVGNKNVLKTKKLHD